MNMSAQGICWHPAPMRLMPAAPSLHPFLRSVSPLVSLISNGLCSQVLRPTPNSPTIELLRGIWRREWYRSCREPQTCTIRHTVFFLPLRRKKCVSYVEHPEHKIISARLLQQENITRGQSRHAKEESCSNFLGWKPR